MPQKVGKHKKRISSAASAIKTDVPADCSFTPAINFDESLGTTAMQTELGSPSFDFSTTDFEFSPDLSNDWQLFPELSIANHNTIFSDPWTHNHSHYDASLYAAQTGMGQSRVSTGMSAVSGPSWSLHEHTLHEAKDSYGGGRGTDIFTTGTIGNLPISPSTDTSQSPVFRTQSSTSQPPNTRPSSTNYIGENLTDHTNLNNSGLYANGLLSTHHYSVGDQMDQTRLSRDKPIQVPLPTPNSRSSPMTEACASQSGLSTSRTTSPGSSVQSHAVETDIGYGHDRGRLRESTQATAHNSNPQSSNAEASLLIRNLLRTNETQVASYSTTSTAKANALSDEKLTKSPGDASPSSTLSRPGSSTEEANPRLWYRVASTASSEFGSQPHSEVPRSTVGSLQTEKEIHRTENSLRQATMCVAALALYSMLGQASDSLAATFALLLVAFFIVARLQKHGFKEEKQKCFWSNALHSRLSISRIVSKEISHLESKRCWSQLRKCPSGMSALSSHLGLRRATAMV